MRYFIRLFIMSIVVASAGCAAIDLTEGHVGDAPKCPFHHTKMHPEKIQVSGESVYVLEYCELAQRTFPNHGGHRYNSEIGDTPWERDVVDWVCPECHREYLSYWENRTSNQRIQPTG